MLEIEIKFLCDNIESVRDRIIKNGGSLDSSGKERDTYYRHPCRDFKNTDEAFRIRHSDSGALMTYKGPKIGDRAKTRFEIETPLQSSEDMELILEKLGFEKAGEVVKSREIYRLSDISVCLDTVDKLGTFVEIEILSDDKEKSENVILQFAENLGLDNMEKRSYLELVLRQENK